MEMRSEFLRRAAADDAASGVILQAMRAGGGTRLSSVMEVLRRRCTPWEEDPTQLVQCVVRYAQARPPRILVAECPIRVVHKIDVWASCQAMRDLPHGRGISDVECWSARAFGAHHLALTVWRVGETATAQVIRTVGAGVTEATRVAMWLDAVLCAVDGARHCEAQNPRGAMAARLKEVIRRHAKCSDALLRLPAD